MVHITLVTKNTQNIYYNGAKLQVILPQPPYYSCHSKNQLTDIQHSKIVSQNDVQLLVAFYPY
jgi:hypothetical protein